MQPAPELVSFVQSMGWNNKIKLYRNSKGKMISGTKGGAENPGDDPDVSKPVKKSLQPVSISALNAVSPLEQRK